MKANAPATCNCMTIEAILLFPMLMSSRPKFEGEDKVWSKCMRTFVKVELTSSN